MSLTDGRYNSVVYDRSKKGIDYIYYQIIANYLYKG